ncbi:hypothetical protein [Nocardioides mangrovicus]|nr:hypothetical protein [Nocardioides mangrovicus]
MTTLDRSKQMNLRHHDLARSHSRLDRHADRAQSARLALARMLYGGHGR